MSRSEDRTVLAGGPGECRGPVCRWESSWSLLDSYDQNNTIRSPVTGQIGCKYHGSLHTTVQQPLQPPPAPGAISGSGGVMCRFDTTFLHEYIMDLGPAMVMISWAALWRCRHLASVAIPRSSTRNLSTSTSTASSQLWMFLSTNGVGAGDVLHH